jgi:multidrug efflux system membrane fusion protein
VSAITDAVVNSAVATQERQSMDRPLSSSFSGLLGPCLSGLSLLLLILWLAAGTLSAQPQTPQPLADKAPEQTLTPVTISKPQQRTLMPKLRVNGEIKAIRTVTIRAQREGLITEKHVTLGQSIDAEGLLAEMDPRDLEAQYNAAQASVNQQKDELAAAKRLGKQKLVGQTRLNEARAAYTQATAQLAQIGIERQLRQITAPFPGVIDAEFIEMGDFVQANAPLFRLVDLSDYRAWGEIAEADLHRVFVGQAAEINLKTGKSISQLLGNVIYVAKTPEPNTRTYRFEIQLTSRENLLITPGQAARIDLISSPVQAFLISPALLHLNNAGQLGIKTLTTTQHVGFVPIEIIKADPQGLWIQGLTPETDVITIGQGYVGIGEAVRATASTSITAP